MRIATSTLNQIGPTGIAQQQSELLRLSNIIASGRTVSLAGDDPVAAAHAVVTKTALSANTQHTANQDAANASLGLESSTLNSAVTQLQKIQTLVAKANNGSLSDSDRAAYATELESARAQLLALANTTDAHGNYVFGGFQTSAAPFSNNPNGAGVLYNGDQGQIKAQVGPTRQLAVNDPGSNVFLSSTPGVASSIATAPSSNAGSATIGVLSTVQAGAASNSDAYTIAFQKDANGNTTYTVTDNTTGTTTQPAAYTDGSAIPLGAGQTLMIHGAPEAGDTFDVAPPSAAQSNVFATIDNLITALRTPSQSPGGHANLANQMASGLQQLGNTYTTMLTTLASVGARQTELKSLKSVGSAKDLTYSSQLSDEVGLTTDKMPGVYEQLVSVSTQLTATQTAFVKTQSLSLFSLIKT